MKNRKTVSYSYIFVIFLYFCDIFVSFTKVLSKIFEGKSLKNILRLYK